MGYWAGLGVLLAAVCMIAVGLALREPTPTCIMVLGVECPQPSQLPRLLTSLGFAFGFLAGLLLLWRWLQTDKGQDAGGQMRAVRASEHVRAAPRLEGPRSQPGGLRDDRHVADTGQMTPFGRVLVGVTGV